MQIELFSFSKRKNSTKKPTSSGTVVSCVFKEETSVMNPSFELSSGSPIGYNYVKAWTNYYYITDCTFVTNGTWRISCRLDSLATYEATIKGMSAFIEYTDTYDARIFDPRLAKKINAMEITNTAQLPGIVFNSTGYYVVNVLGKDGTGAYIISQTKMSQLAMNIAQWWSDFIGDHTWTDLQETFMNMCALLITGDAAANVKSCKWVPGYYPGQGSGGSDKIFAGIYDTYVVGTKIGYHTKWVSPVSVTVPHPTSVMLRTSQTCEYTLYIPFIGNINISSDLLADESSLTIQFSLAACTGELAVLVKTGSGKVIGTYGANVGVDVPIGSAGVSARSVTNGLITAGAVIGGVALTDAEKVGAKDAIVGTAKVAKAGLSGIQASNTCVGGIGSCAAFGLDYDISLTCSYWDISDSGSSLTGLIGNPYYKVDTIGNHGYVSCSGASIDAIAYDDITNEINAYLRSGIYVE